MTKRQKLSKAGDWAKVLHLVLEDTIERYWMLMPANATGKLISEIKN